MAVRNSKIAPGTLDWQPNEAVLVEDINDTAQALRNQLDETFGETAGLYSLPIGTILPWLKNMSGMPTLPEGWAECDGVNGRPYLNGNSDANKRFLRGTTDVTGGIGGTHQHNHVLPTQTYGGNTSNWASSPTSTNVAIPKYFEVVFIIRVV